MEEQEEDSGAEGGLVVGVSEEGEHDELSQQRNRSSSKSED